MINAGKIIGMVRSQDAVTQKLREEQAKQQETVQGVTTHKQRKRRKKLPARLLRLT